MIRVRDNLREYPELLNTTIGDLEYTHLSDVRRIAKCYDILNTHACPLIVMKHYQLVVLKFYHVNQCLFCKCMCI